MGEGGTALVGSDRMARWIGLEGPIWLKDESRNPTWSHKDRLNYCIVCAALRLELAASLSPRPETTAPLRRLMRAARACLAS